MIQTKITLPLTHQNLNKTKMTDNTTGKKTKGKKSCYKTNKNMSATQINIVREKKNLIPLNINWKNRYIRMSLQSCV